MPAAHLTIERHANKRNGRDEKREIVGVALEAIESIQEIESLADDAHILTQETFFFF